MAPRGTPTVVMTAATPAGSATGRVRDQGSAASYPTMDASAARAVATSRVSVVTQSRERQAGSTPVVGTSPRGGLTPTSPLKGAGTRPGPAGSGPGARGTIPLAPAPAGPGGRPPLA